jgi:hypothetical protein
MLNNHKLVVARPEPNRLKGLYDNFRANLVFCNSWQILFDPQHLSM